MHYIFAFLGITRGIHNIFIQLTLSRGHVRTSKYLIVRTLYWDAMCVTSCISIGNLTPQHRRFH